MTCFFRGCAIPHPLDPLFLKNWQEITLSKSFFEKTENFSDSGLIE